MKMKSLNLPRLFYVILIIELCERLAFYGVQAVAVFYFIHTLKVGEAESANLFASFSALSYALLVLGGFIGDKVIGLRRTYFLGILSLLAGYLLVALVADSTFLYIGMGFIAVGNVLFKPNANNYVGHCFPLGDPRIDAGFTYYYMVINIGILIGTIVVPIVAQVFGYKAGLMICAVSIGCGLGLYLIFVKDFASADNLVGDSNNHFRMIGITAVTILIAIFISVLLHNLYYSGIVLYTVLTVSVLIYLFIMSTLNTKEARKMFVAFILWIFSIVFFISYIQIATSMTLFALHDVDLTLFGFTLPAGVTQGLASFFIIVVSPLLSGLYLALNKRHLNYSLANKFATGILFVGFCFLVLSISNQFFANANSKVAIYWLILAYALYATGELLVSALGASMIVQLLPKKLCGFGQGIWYLGAAIGMKLGGQIFAGFEVGTKVVSSSVYIKFFYLMGLFTIVVALILFIIAVPLSKFLQKTATT